MGVTWTHGRLSAKTLHEALRAIGLDPSEQLYINLYRDPPSPLEVDPEALARLTEHSLHGGPVIALGKRGRAISSTTAFCMWHSSIPPHHAERIGIVRGRPQLGLPSAIV